MIEVRFFLGPILFYVKIIIQMLMIRCLNLKAKVIYLRSGDTSVLVIKPEGHGYRVVGTDEFHTSAYPSTWPYYFSSDIFLEE